MQFDPIIKYNLQIVSYKDNHNSSNADYLLPGMGTSHIDAFAQLRSGWFVFSSLTAVTARWLYQLDTLSWSILSGNA